MFYGKFADEEDKAVGNPIHYNVEGDNRLLPGLQPLTTRSALKICLFLGRLSLYLLYQKLFCRLLQNKTFKFLNILRVVDNFRCSPRNSGLTLEGD